MSGIVELLNWRNVLVPQRNATGCIPTGFEWLIRYNKITNVNLETFQDDFDLERRKVGENNFGSIAAEIMRRYPHVTVNTEKFDTGEKKMNFILEQMRQNIPCVMSLTTSPKGGWHIVPIISMDTQRMKIIWVVNQFGYQIHDYTKGELVYRHNNWPGGRDIAWIQATNE